MSAVADCEAIGEGLLKQPVNALTTLAFLPAAAWIAIRRPDRRWVAVAVGANGVGSFLFHGPITPGSEWAHDTALLWLLVVVATTDTRLERFGQIPGLVVTAVLLAVFPALGDPLTVVVAAVAIVVRLWIERTAHTIGAMLLLGVTAVLGRLGATDWPLCDPESIWQTHGLWHIGAAVALAWWGGQRTV